MLDWTERFSIFCFLDNNEYSIGPNRYECLLGVQRPYSIASRTFDTMPGAADGEPTDHLSLLYKWHKEHKYWLLGHISYDYKNVLEKRLTTSHQDHIGFPSFHFFCPDVVCYIHADKKAVTIECLDEDPAVIYRDITATDPEVEEEPLAFSFTPRFDRDAYLKAIQQLRQHIADGDCYEINFCNESYAENRRVDMHSIFKKLKRISPAPFAAFYCLREYQIACASPERYLFKEGDKILTQPIKGTARRDKDKQKDALIKEELYDSIKERAENVMIVDLMRNDLARSCKTGSINVDELFGIYSFPQVHQMISTISGTLAENIPFTDAIRHSFPMGSMTGAPKIKVMELIEKYERTARGLFSGTIGYINPDGDFDFNVIIRSIFYNQKDRYLSYQTGGAITYDSIPLKEWEEMRLKAWALEQAFKEPAP